LSAPLPRLVDCKGIQDEMGVKRATADRVMRHCTRKVRIGRKVFVYRAEAAEVVKKLEISEAA